MAGGIVRICDAEGGGATCPALRRHRRGPARLRHKLAEQRRDPTAAAVTGELDELGSLLVGKGGEKGVQAAAGLELELMALVRHRREVAIDPAVVRLGLGEFGPDLGEHRLRVLAHMTGAYAQAANEALEGLALRRVEGELFSHRLEALGRRLLEA